MAVIVGRGARAEYCSDECKFKCYHGNNRKCVQCGNELTYQRDFCSFGCHMLYRTTHPEFREQVSKGCLASTKFLERASTHMQNINEQLKNSQEFRAYTNQQKSRGHRASSLHLKNSRKQLKDFWSNPQNAEATHDTRTDLMRGKMMGWSLKDRIVYNDKQFRSLPEALYAWHLDRQGLTWRYEPWFFKVVLDGRVQRYIPDFYIVDDNTHVEIKGEKFLPKSLAKIEAVVAQYNLTLNIITESEVNKLVTGVS